MADQTVPQPPLNVPIHKKAQPPSQPSPMPKVPNTVDSASKLKGTKK